MEILNSEDANLILDYDLLIVDYKMDESSVFQELQTSLRRLASKFVNYGSTKDRSSESGDSLIYFDRFTLNEYFNVLDRYRFYCKSNTRRLKIIKDQGTHIRVHFEKKFRFNHWLDVVNELLEGGRTTCSVVPHEKEGGIYYRRICHRHNVGTGSLIPKKGVLEAQSDPCFNLFSIAISKSKSWMKLAYFLINLILRARKRFFSLTSRDSASSLLEKDLHQIRYHGIPLFVKPDSPLLCSVNLLSRLLVWPM